MWLRESFSTVICVPKAKGEPSESVSLSADQFEPLKDAAPFVLCCIAVLIGSQMTIVLFIFVWMRDSWPAFPL
jgi:hypothetical protein